MLWLLLVLFWPGSSGSACSSGWLARELRENRPGLQHDARSDRMQVSAPMRQAGLETPPTEGNALLVDVPGDARRQRTCHSADNSS